MIDAEVAVAIGRGIGQIVLLGAGYDGRALRFGGGSVRWFEVDEAARQADKRRRLAALGREPATVAYVERGPRDRGPGRRAGGGRTPRGPSLALRLRRPAHPPDPRGDAALCAALRARAAPGSVLVADFRVAPETGRPGRALRLVADLFLRVLGEPGATSSVPVTPRS